MHEKKIAVIGAYGYARLIIEEILKNGERHGARLAAVVDVSPKLQEERARFESKGVSVYEDMRSMYDDMDIDLVVVASPIQYHSTHACMAMENGSHVLLEKPVGGSMDDAEEIEHCMKRTGKKLLVGFQLVYDETIRKVKEIALSGYLGGLCDIKMIVLWPRNKAYFNRNSWAGKISDREGRLIYDSVANNANAHHFMNLLYLAGNDMDSAGHVEELEADLYRANDIETFDTCTINAKLIGGIGMLAIASHAVKVQQDPKYMLWFENGYIESVDDVWAMHTKKGSEIIGKSNHMGFNKVWDMINYIDDDSYRVKCTLDCAKEHTYLIERLSALPVSDFAEGIKEAEDGQMYVEGLADKLNREYDGFKGPPCHGDMD